MNSTILVRPEQRRELTTREGIVLAETEQIVLVYGEVIASGPGSQREGAFLSNTLEPGDHVVFNAMFSTDIAVDGEIMLFVEEQNVLAKLTPDEVVN